MSSRWVVILPVVLGLGALSLLTNNFRTFTEETARRLEVLERPWSLPETQLVDMHKRALDLTQYAGRVLLVDFIYTDCPWICYAMGSTLERVQQELAARGLGDRVAVLSISFNPASDSPEELAEYAARFGATGEVWNVATTADSADLEALLDAFGITVIPDAYGGFTHNAAIHVVSKDSKLVAIADFEDPAAIVKLVEAQL